ncbi:MAG TPA: metallophosphoesterase, partial [Candidatus Aminicenantes bacterium]|nr:metallophosphoesterase [Candidatus Aminicenantes bacterium]
MTAVFWPSLLNGLPVATAVFLLLHFRLRAACPPPCSRGWRWISSLPAALFPLTLAAGLLARPSLPPLLRGAGSAWLRWMSLLLLAVMVETALSRFFPGARRLWVLGTMAVSLLALPLLQAFSPRFYPFAMFCRESKVVLGMALVHGFVLLRLHRGLPVPTRLRPWLALPCWLGGGWFPLHYLRLVPWAGRIGGTWAGFVLLLGATLLLETVLSTLVPRHRRQWTRLALAVALVATGIAAWQGERYPAVHQVSVPVAGLPPSLAGFSLVAVTDLHLRGAESPGRLEEIVRRVNVLRPDLIVLVGDTVERPIPPAMAETLGRLTARHGVVAVTGNHEFYDGVERFTALARRLGFTLLRNRNLVLTGGLQVAGVDDLQGGLYTIGGADLNRALRGTRRDQPTILLCHSPRRFRQAARRGVTLQISGHT